MINKSKDNDNLFRNADDFGSTFYVDEDNIGKDLKSKFKNNCKTNKENNTSHANPESVQCALLLMGLDEKVSNFEERFEQYQKLFDLVGKVYSVRDFRTSNIIATVVFFQRMDENLSQVLLGKS